MPNDEPLDPNHQLRWAIEHLPSPAAVTDTVARVEAPSLEGPDAAPILVEFRRDARDRDGRRLDGWLYEGKVSIEATELGVESGFPGIDSWIRGKLGPYCVELEVSSHAGGSATIRAFSTTRDRLDEVTAGRA